MDNKKINDEIEILDGLDDFFASTNEVKENVQENENVEPIKENIQEEKVEVKEDTPIFSFNDELFIPSEEEVLNVLSEPVVDMDKIKEEEKNENPFSNFVPDTLNVDDEKKESLLKDPVSETKEENKVEQTPSMDEIFYMDFDEYEKENKKFENSLDYVNKNEQDKINFTKEEKQPVEETTENLIGNTNTINDVDVKPFNEDIEINDNKKIEPFDESDLSVNDSKVEPFSEEPVENSFNNNINNSIDQTPKVEEDLDKTNFALDDILEPITLESDNSKAGSNLDYDNMGFEPVKEENNSVDNTNFDINYTFSDQLKSDDLDNSIDNAFTFDNIEPTTQKEPDLGKTVIIEPVDLKPIEKVEEPVVKSDEKVEEVKDSNDDQVKPEIKEETKEVSKTEVKTKNKKDGRLFVLILLIVMLLLSFVILLPTIIEKFAI